MRTVHPLFSPLQLRSGIATGGSRGWQSTTPPPPPHSERIAKNQEKSGKRKGKSGKTRGKNLEEEKLGKKGIGSFTLPPDR